MARTAPDDPRDWWGTREVKPSPQPCGWCADALFFDWAKHFHEKCVHEIAYFQHLWVCPCECNKDWVPVQVEVPRPESPAVSKKRPAPRRKKVEEPTDEATTDESD